MSIWECVVCGLVYDEAIGWPEDGIAPGTKWEDVPEEWLCPDCGVGKDDFEMVKVKESGDATIEVNSDMDPVVIIGSGLAAYNLGKEFRKLDKTTPVVMISRDDGCLYYKPNLSCSLTNNKTPDELVISLGNVVEADLSLTLKSFTEVTEIDATNNIVYMGFESLKYSKLVLATGASAVRPPFAGNGTDLIHSVNDLLDYRKYRGELVGKSRVVIIGAGLIGCEFTNDLINRGLNVEVIDAVDHCMANLLPKQVAQTIENALMDKGVTFYFSSKVTSVDKTVDGLSVTLDDGKQLKSDLVLSAVGLRANTALAEKAGIATDNGISVNRYLETSARDIYALGDCVKVEGQSLMYVEPLLLSAKALAKTLMGKRTSVEFGAMSVAVKTPACPVVVAAPPQGISGTWDVRAVGSDVAALCHNEEGKLIGFALTGKEIDQKNLLTQSLLKP